MEPCKLATHQQSLCGVRMVPESVHLAPRPNPILFGTVLPIEHLVAMETRLGDFVCGPAKPGMWGSDKWEVSKRKVGEITD